MGKTLIITQCSKRKKPIELFNISVSVLDILRETRENLVRGRKYFEKYVYGSKLTTALSLYNGVLYRELDKKLVYDKFLSGKIDFIIVSAAYGIVHAFEKIREYELRMNREVAETWLKMGLPKVLEEYIIRTNADSVYGFFTKTSYYAKIYGSINRTLLDYGVEAYLVMPGNVKFFNSLKTLGSCIMSLIEHGSLDKCGNVKILKLNT